MVIIVGIDPGLSGGWARFDATGLTAGRMPVRDGELDFGELYAVFRNADVVAVERPFAPKGREAGMMQAWRRVGQKEALAWAQNARVVLVDPKRWQSALDGWVAAPGEDTKDKSRAWVRERYGLALMVPPRCRKEHDGIADAVCIASWARQTIGRTTA